MELPITIVSGLPRSGTSLLMQMLGAGGIDPVTDGQRVADADNPRGYFELEAVKQLKKDAGWIAGARGKAVKVISHLLGDLPTGEHYRIVFVERDLDEVLASQAKMIVRCGAAAPPEEVVRRAFETHLLAFDRVAAGRPDWSVLRVRYAELIAEPSAAAERLAEFFAGATPSPLRVEAMAGAVDPTLYRNRRDA